MNKHPSTTCESLWYKRRIRHHTYTNDLFIKHGTNFRYTVPRNFCPLDSYNYVL